MIWPHRLIQYASTFNFVMPALHEDGKWDENGHENRENHKDDEDSAWLIVFLLFS
jgi:hypothetical protein